MEESTSPEPHYEDNVLEDQEGDEENIGQPESSNPYEKVIIVDIQREDNPKPFIGGFRHRQTQVEFHHAFTQTWIPKPPKEHIEKNHRDTQTATFNTLGLQSNRESSAQTKRPGLFIDEVTDRKMDARPYTNAQSFIRLRELKAIVIQCYARGWFARKVARQMREDVIAKRNLIAQREADRRELSEKQRLEEMQRRMHPRTKEDFDILYNELEAWRQRETKRINTATELNELEKHQALAQLLYKETKFLQTIDRLKVAAGVENREERIRRQLELMSAPKKWALQTGEVSDVHTPFTTRARELLDLHNGLRMKDLSIDERLDVLLHVKWTVKEFDCNLTRELVSLIDREADMLNRGRQEKSLTGLRQRICNLFLQFEETPEFNPEAARFQRVPRELLQRPELQPIPSRAGSRHQIVQPVS